MITLRRLWPRLAATLTLIAGAALPAALDAQTADRPPLTATPGSVELRGRANGTVRASAQVAILANGSSTVVGDLTVSRTGTGPTLDLTLVPAETPATLVITLGAQGLAGAEPGVYVDTVVVAAPAWRAARIPVRIIIDPPVQLEVTGFDPDTGIVLLQHEGSPPATLTTTVRNSAAPDGTGGRDVSAFMVYEKDSLSGWVRPTLAAAQTPTTLTLAVVPEALFRNEVQKATLVLAASGADTLRIPVTVRTLPAKGVIALGATRLDLAAPEVAGGVVERTVSVTNSGPGSADRLRNLEVSVATDDGLPWLGAALDASRTPTVLRVRGDATGLRVGVYRGTVTVRDREASNVRTLPVTLTVGAAPRLAGDRDSVVLVTRPEVAEAREATVAIMNAGSGGSSAIAGLAVRVTAEGVESDWLSATISSQQTPATLRLVVRERARPAGELRAIVEVTSTTPGVEVLRLPVRLVVEPDAGLAVSPGALTVARLVGEGTVDTTLSVTGAEGELSVAGTLPPWLTARVDGTTLHLTLRPGAEGVAATTLTVADGERLVAVPVRLVVAAAVDERLALRGLAVPGALTEAQRAWLDAHGTGDGQLTLADVLIHLRRLRR